MPRISAMPSAAVPLTGLERVPFLQGGGPGASRGAPLLVVGPPFGGAPLVIDAPMATDMSATSEADPGAGALRWNDANPHDATEVYISDVDADAEDLTAQLATLVVGGYLYVQGAGSSAAHGNLQRWQVTGISPEAGFTKLAVTLQASAGTFADEDEIKVSIQQPLPAPGVDRNLVTAVSSVSGTTTIDASLGDYFTTTLDEDTELVVTNVPPACTLALSITQGTPARTVDWPATWDWGEGASAPTLSLTAGDVLDVIITTFDSGASWVASARNRA